jgi:hypothetical protein
MATPSPIHHGPSSRRLGKARAHGYSQASSSTSPHTPQFSQTGSQASSYIRLDSRSSSLSPPLQQNKKPTHEYPTEDKAWVPGVKFDVNFNHVYRKGQRLEASRLGYAVVYKSVAARRREPSDIWLHGLQLQYIEADGDPSTTKLWLCKLCHQRRERSDAMGVSGTTHIRIHIQKRHNINPSTGSAIPQIPLSIPNSPFTTAAHVPGSSTITSHVPWEEESFQDALIDWTIMRDLSFSDVTCSSTRGLLTWNRSNLLNVLPDSPTTLSSYINKRVNERKLEVAKLLQSAAGKISVSLDVWTSNNHISFLGIVAHFVG